MVSTSMGAQRFHGAGAIACAALLLAASASADPDQAAALFDEGVRKYDAAEYEAAAAAFLRADEISPNRETLINALRAGRKGHAHLLVARAAERVLAREGSDADLARDARKALVEASTHLAHVQLSCAPEPPGEAAAPCAIAVDGASTPAGAHYMLPGTHRFAGEVAGGGRDEQPLTCDAGATYTVVLRPAARVPPAASAGASAAAGGEPPRGWPPAVVYVGAGATAILAGVAVWSGVDALDAKGALPAVPERKQNEDVLARAARTDALVAGAAVVGIATAAAAIWLVAWDRPGASKASLGVAPSSSGASLLVRGRF